MVVFANGCTQVFESQKFCGCAKLTQTETVSIWPAFGKLYTILFAYRNEQHMNVVHCISFIAIVAILTDWCRANNPEYNQNGRQMNMPNMQPANSPSSIQILNVCVDKVNIFVNRICSFYWAANIYWQSRRSRTVQLHIKILRLSVANSNLIRYCLAALRQTRIEYNITWELRACG